MPRYIAKVIELNSGNKYREGQGEGVPSDIRPYNSKERKQAYTSRKRGYRPGDNVDKGILTTPVIDTASNSNDEWLDIDTIDEAKV